MAKDLLIRWLNDAYGMEQSLIPVLQNRADDAKDHPMVQNKIREHVEKTRRHADMLEGRIRALGASPSAVKSAISGLFGQVQAVATGGAEDEMVKNALSDFAAEQFEIAAHKALITAAQEIGDQETARVCQDILRDEEDMARFLDQHLPMSVQQTVRQFAVQRR